MKFIKSITIASTLLFANIALAQTQNDTLSDLISGNAPVKQGARLTDTDKKTLEIVNEWRNGNRVSPVSRGNNGEVELIYGLTQPNIITAILQVTDIQFEEGEDILSVHLGDTSRWIIEHVKSVDRQHLIVKPKDDGLLTSLIVITDRRTYHLQLKSKKNSYFPMVKFHYPSSIIARNIKNFKPQSNSNNNIYTDNLNFTYKIKGKAPFKPTRIYNDGHKTFIELAHSVKAANIPVLMTIEPESKKPVIVNYRFKNNKFIVDSIFDKAILISGVGMKQKKITITRGK